MEASLPGNVKLRWVLPPVSLADLPVWGRMPVTTYQKLMLGDWLPADVTRAIWLDGDLIVMNDLASLPMSGRGGEIALAAQDESVPKFGSPFGVAGHRELGLSAP